MTELTERLDHFEGRLRTMEDELDTLRRLAAENAQAPEPPLWELFEAETAPEPEPARQPKPLPVWAPPPRKQREPVDLSILLGARTLAWTGGAVTLLGIVFFFVLAVERGWIGPGARVALGASVSALLVGAALWLRRRFGDTYAALSAAGVGIAGFYTTLLAATALYHLVPPGAALVAAAAIAAVGGTLAWSWRSETLATLGLLGAILAPVPIALQGGLTTVGVVFAALVLAATASVAVLRDWRVLHVAAVASAAPQAIALSLEGPAHAAVGAAAVWLVLATVPTWLALRTRLSYLPAWLLLFSAVVGGWSAAFLYHGDTRGYVLLALASAYGAAGTVLYRRDRDTSSLHLSLGLTLAAVGSAALFSDATLTIVWSAEAAVLAWLALRIREPRFQLGALVWLLIAYVHGLALDAPLSKLFVENDEPWRSAPSAAALALASAALAVCTFDWADRPEGVLARMLTDLRNAQPVLRVACFALAGVSAVYAGSLVVVGLPHDWAWGHVLVAALWSSVAVALVATRLRRWSIGALAACVALTVVYDLTTLVDPQRAWTFAIVAAAAIVIAVVYELRAQATPTMPAALALTASVVLAAASAYELLDGGARAWMFLALAAGYAATGVAVHAPRRDFASLLGIAALALAFPASVWLLEGTWLVLAWVLLAGSLTLLARFEERLELGALAYVGAALVHTLVFEAQPTDVFVAHSHPGSGVPAVLLVAGALALFKTAHTRLRWLCGALGLYAATLAILEASEDLGGGIDTAFQRGHTAVSALWAIVGLALLVVGLKRSRALVIGGFALFGISLAKLFLYDLAFLNSVTRAFSFVAVGMLILVAGFFYQRMTLESHA